MVYNLLANGLGSTSWPKVRNTSQIFSFRHKSDVSGIDALLADTYFDTLAKVIEVHFYDWPTFLDEHIIEPIRSKRFVIR